MSSSGRQVALFWLSFAGVLAVAGFGLRRLGARPAEQAPLADLAAARAEPTPFAAQLLRSQSVAAPRLDGEFPCVLGEVVGGRADPRLGRCALPTAPSGPVDRFEADLRYGRFILRQSDLFLRDVFPVPLTRTYNSGDYLHPNRVHAFGKNANHPFDIAPLGTRNPYTHQFLGLEDGDFLYFSRVSPGTDFADAVFQHTETSTRFYRAVTSWNGSGWTTWLTDGTKLQFPEAYRAKSMAQGALTGISDAAGNRLELRRDRLSNLLEIRTPHGRSIQLAHDDRSRIVRAEDDAGQWAEYRYDQDGMLSDATLSSGRARHYSYAGALMTRIEDEHRQALLINTYEGTWLARQDFGNGAVYSYGYTAPPRGGYAEHVVVTLPDGRKTDVEVASSVPDVVRHPER